MEPNRRQFLGLSASAAASAAANQSRVANTDITSLSPEQLATAKEHSIHHIKELFAKLSQVKDTAETSLQYTLSSPETSLHYSDDSPNSYSEYLIENKEPVDSATTLLNEAVEAHKKLFGEIQWNQILPENDQWHRILLKRKYGENIDVTIDDTSIQTIGLDIEKYTQKARLCDEVAQFRNQLIHEIEQSSIQLGDTKAEKIVEETIKRIFNAKNKNGLQYTEQHQQAIDHIRKHGMQEVQKQIQLNTENKLEDERLKENRWQKSLENSPNKLTRTMSKLDNDKMFLALSDKKEIATEKLKLLNELIVLATNRSSGMFTSKLDLTRMQHEITTSDIFPTNCTLPDDRYVPVPTQHYHDTYGIEVSHAQFEAIEKFMRHYPNIAKELSISDFGSESQPSRT